MAQVRSARGVQTTGIPWRGIVLLIVALIIVLGVLLFQPWGIAGLVSHPRPVRSYEEALQRIERLRAQEPATLNPVCRLQFMTHNRKVERAIVLVHGYTTCPQQFHALGQRFFDLGYNVLIAPFPHHGLADRMTDEQAQFTAAEMATYADEVVDIAQGLGERVSMAGLSAGGVTTGWAAQYRTDIDKAMLISPAFGAEQIPTPLTAAVTNVFSLLPDTFTWWDPVNQDKDGIPYAYPRYSRHALVQTFRLGFAVQAGARRSRPAANKLIVVTNANDHSVNNEMTRAVVQEWQAHGATIVTYEFPADLRLDHDLIDPLQPTQRVDLVYPRLIQLLTQD